MIETEWLFETIRIVFGDRPSRSKVRDWLLDHQWEVMNNMFPGCGALLESVPDSTYDMLVDDFVANLLGDGLAERLIEYEFDLREDE